MKTLLTTTYITALATAGASAALTFTGTTITEDFTGYDGSSGPTGWDASGFSSGTGFTENRGVSTGGETTGGTYAFDIGGGNIALGLQQTGTDFTPGYYELVLTNNSGATVTHWNIAFNAYFYNDQNRSSSFAFSYSNDGSNYTAVPSGSFSTTEAEDITPSWELGVAYSDTISNSVTNGGNLYLRWTADDIGGSGSRDEIALDNVSISAVPEPTSVSLLGLGGILTLLRRKR